MSYNSSVLFESWSQNLPSITTSQPVQITSMFSHPLHTKLDSTNLLQWKQQALPAIKGNRHLPYIQAKDVLHQNFRQMKVRQQVKSTRLSHFVASNYSLCWLFESIRGEVQIQMVGCETYFEAWENVSRLSPYQNNAIEIASSNHQERWHDQWLSIFWRQRASLMLLPLLDIRFPKTIKSYTYSAAFLLSMTLLSYLSQRGQNNPKCGMRVPYYSHIRAALINTILLGVTQRR